MVKDNEDGQYWIRDYFGPYPIDWDLYDLAMGIKQTTKIDFTTKIKTNVYEIYKEHKEKSEKNPKK
jgi:hypothetical protein